MEDNTTFIMKTRAALVVVILAGLATTGLNVILMKDKITSLQSNLRDQSASRLRAESDLAITKEGLQQTRGALQQTAAALKTAEEANQTLLASVEEQNARADKISQRLALIQEKYDDARANLAAYESVMTIQQAANASRQIKGLQQALAAMEEENGALAKVVAQREAELNFTHGTIVSLPAELAGTVLATDPKWRFVVLDAGKDQGVVKRGELLVSRGGKLVGKVIVQRVEKDRSIADVMPGWELTEILEGDAVIPAHPKS